MVFPTGGGESKNLEKMEALYVYVRKWGMEEEDGIPFSSCKVVGEYWNSVDPTSLLDNYTTMFPELESLTNSCV